MKKLTPHAQAVSKEMPLAEISPQLLGDMRECSDVEKIADVPNSGIELLEDMKDRLALEGSELQRMEYEGGLPLKPSQKIQVNACLKASQRIKTLLLTIPKKLRSKKT